MFDELSRIFIEKLPEGDIEKFERISVIKLVKYFRSKRGEGPGGGNPAPRGRQAET
jgi:hypothetical protein